MMVMKVLVMIFHLSGTALHLKRLCACGRAQRLALMCHWHTLPVKSDSYVHHTLLQLWVINLMWLTLECASAAFSAAAFELQVARRGSFPPYSSLDITWKPFLPFQPHPLVSMQHVTRKWCQFFLEILWISSAVQRKRYLLFQSHALIRRPHYNIGGYHQHSSIDIL